LTKNQILEPIKIGWKDNNSQHFNKAVSYHFNNSIEAIDDESDTGKQEFLINIEKVLMAKGEMPPPVITSLTRDNSEICLEWETKLLDKKHRQSDSMILAVWRPGSRAKVFIDLGNRAKGNARVLLPHEFQEPTHFWAFYRNMISESPKSELNVSNSVYLGEK
jgi:hypothetical protein